MTAFSKLIKGRRGAALTEFALSSVLMIFILMGTLEFGLEVFLRQEVERAAGDAALVYATTRSPEMAQDAANAAMLDGFVDCLEPLDIILHDNIASLENGSGRQAAGDATDDSARIARVALTCRWDRLTPGSRILLGEVMVHQTAAYVRIRE